jgi:putative nucleotidyltransferase with HDIG domain
MSKSYFKVVRDTTLLIRLMVICLCILVIGLAHWITPASPYLLSVHVILRKLFVVPIVLAAIWFEVRGAILCGILVSMIYFPHIFMQWAGDTSENINQIGEIVSIWIIAILSGIFVRIDKKALREVAQTHEGSLMALTAALDVREHNTGLHSLRVRDYALRLGRELNLGQADLNTLGKASLLHDIGKIGIPDHILLKKHSPTEAEWDIMCQHADMGQQILLSVPFLKEAASIVHSHHEHYDGSGYSQALKANQIPLGARIFAVVDAYDALTSCRPYHLTVTCSEAQKIIKEDSGKHFDPDVVKTFLRIPCEEWVRINQQLEDKSKGVNLSVKNGSS